MTFYNYILSYIEWYDFTANVEKTNIRYCFMIKKLCEDLPVEFKYVIDRDIDKLVNDEEYLLDLELKLHSDFPLVYRSHFSLFLKLLSVYAETDIKRASSFFMDGNEFRCIELYALNRNLTNSLIKKLKSSYVKLTPDSKKVSFKPLRKLIIDSNEFALSTNLEELVEKLKSIPNLKKNYKSSIHHLFEDKLIIDILGQSIDITEYYKLNPIFLAQFNKIKENIKNKTELKRFTTFTYTFKNYLKNHPTDEKYFIEYGFLSLVENNYEILLKIRDTESTKIFNYFVFVVDILTETKFSYIKNDHKCLYIENDYGRSYKLLLDNLYKRSPKFASEFYELFKNYNSKIKYHNQNEVSIRSRISGLRKIFTDFDNVVALDKHGIKILSMDNLKHFKSIKEKIYEDRIQKRIKLATQNNYYNSLKWFCEITNQKYIKDFDEQQGANKEILRRYSSTRSYSEQELMELLDHLIKAIKLFKDDYSRLLVAYFALIQIITGMNLSTLCSLKNNSEYIRVDDKNPNIYYLNFLKRRASNKTEKHTFFKKTEDKTIYLFLYIRDVLRDKVIELAKNKDFTTDYFFVFLSKKGELQVATFDNIGSKINELLTSSGCSITYDSKRMRKTVSNRIYKIVLKKFSVYRELLHHDFDVFVRHYEEINTFKTNDNLSQGTKSLEIYLKKDNIHLEEPEIKEIDLINDNIIQFTPLGNCSDSPPENINYCSDYLACLFCKNFSVVNNEDQIHKLLDFKNICISQMLEISFKYNTETSTAIAIREFENRVDYVLRLLNKSNPELYALAQINYEPNQYFSL